MSDHVKTRIEERGRAKVGGPSVELTLLCFIDTRLCSTKWFCGRERRREVVGE